MNEPTAKSYTDIWAFDKEVLAQNNKNHKDGHNLPDVELIAENIHGYVINSIGNIVAKFGFFVDGDNSEPTVLNVPIHTDGFLAGVYHKPTNIILGYGHPLGIPAVVDIRQSQILHLSPEKANGENFIINVDNDSNLKEHGIICIIRDIDVILDVLSPEVAADFKTSLEDAAQLPEELNEIEQSYNLFIKHFYTILGQDFNT